MNNPRIHRYAMTSKRVIGAFRMFWGGRKPSKYMPHVGKKQLAKLEAAK